MADQNILDKSMRSVFVGNIPYEATEEKLKDIFNEVGPVISFKLVYDRETGKPKGYGFCEYKDQETALSAMRNLNGYEIGGRTLRVDNACTEKSRLEMQSLMMGMPTSESHYGEAVSPEKAPEIINNVVSTLPPEQLYELMKQMKACIQNNPVEARNMLLQNPQLGYALLQGQVIMKIVEPEVAKTMLHPVHQVPQPIKVLPNNNNASTSRAQPMPQQMPHNNVQWRKTAPLPPDNIDWHGMNRGHGIGGHDHLRQHSNQMRFHPPQISMPVESHQSFMGSRDYSRPPVTDCDSRQFGDMYRDLRVNTSYMNVPPPMTIPPPMAMPSMSAPPPMNIIPPMTAPPPPPPILSEQLPSRMNQSTQPQAPKKSTPDNPSASDTEKAALILQVLQLTEAQISKLPADQRKSIMTLKEKIAASTRIPLY